MKIALLALALLTGCSSTPASALSMPSIQVRSGVRIEVSSLIGSWTRPVALAGRVENVSAETVESLYLRFDGLGYQGGVVGSASTTMENLGPGESRRFRASFPSPTPHGLHQITIGEVRTRRPRPSGE